ncbi:17820_t:CDS:2, partial [Cetraspora pellucida]
SELYFENKEMTEIKEELNFELKNHFRPEFLNRLDEIIFFNFLSRKVIREIISKELQLFIQRIASEKNIKLRYSEEVVEKILGEAYSLEYGARPIKHYIEKKIGTLIGRGIVSQFLHMGANYALNLEEGTKEIKMTVLPALEQKKNNLLGEKLILTPPKEKLCPHPQITNLTINKNKIKALLADGREINGYEIYWPDLKEVIGVETFTEGLLGACYGYQFYFKKGEPLIPYKKPHVHVRGQGGRIEFYLPSLAIKKDDKSMPRVKINQIRKILQIHGPEFLVE